MPKELLTSPQDVMEELFGAAPPFTGDEKQAETSSSEEKEEIKSEEVSKDEESETQKKEVKEEGSKDDKKETEQEKDEDPVLGILGIKSVPKDEEGIKALLEKAAKIITDNRTSFNTERVSKLETEKKAAEYEKQIADFRKSLEEKNKAISEKKIAEAAVDDEVFINKALANFDDDPRKALEELTKGLRGEIRKSTPDQSFSKEEMEKLVAAKVLEIRENEFMAKTPDYNEVMQDFIPVLENNSEVNAEWTKGGGTPEKAYEMAKAHKEASEMLKDPAGYREKLLEELKKEMGSSNGSGQSKEVKTLSGITSKGNSGPPSKEVRRLETVDDLNLWTT